jgi:hypothetical protein
MSVAEHGSKAVSQLISRLVTVTRSAAFMPAESSVVRRSVAAMDGEASVVTRGAAGGSCLPGLGNTAEPRGGPALAASGLLSGWDFLVSSVRGQAPYLSAPHPASRGRCAACRIPVPAGNARCYPCGVHAETLPGLLADAVVPICYAVKGGEHARNLWLYKSGRPGAGQARAAMRALLVVFLRDHGQCVWRSAGMTGPTHLAVVPSGRWRPGPHPLQALAGPCLSLPLAALEG